MKNTYIPSIRQYIHLVHCMAYLFALCLPPQTIGSRDRACTFIHPQSEDHHSLSGIRISSLSSPTTFLNDSCRISTYVESSLVVQRLFFFKRSTSVTTLINIHWWHLNGPLKISTFYSFNEMHSMYTSIDVFSEKQSSHIHRAHFKPLLFRSIFAITKNPKLGKSPWGRESQYYDTYVS